MQLLSMPRLGQTMDAGTIVTIHVRLGQDFVAGHPLITVETEKVETEIEAKADGRLLRWLVEEGDELEVGAPVAVLGSPDETGDEAAVDAFVASVARAHPPAIDDGGTLPGPAPVPGRSSGEPVRAVPRARALAKEHGVDLSSIASPDGGTITVADVEAHLSGRVGDAPDGEPTAPGTPATSAASGRSGTSSLTGHRRAMSTSMARSWATIPHFTEMIEVDASSMLTARSRHAGPGRPPTVTAYLLAAFAQTCRAVPLLHAGLVDGDVREREHVDIAVAVDTDRGLVAPVMRGVDLLDVDEIATRLADLAGRARERRLRIEDVEGGHVTLSNLGAYGVDAGAPIIPPGQTAMLFAGSIVERAVVVDRDIVARPTMWLSLTCDHRLIDGATAARALRSLRHSLESPWTD